MDENSLRRILRQELRYLVEGILPAAEDIKDYKPARQIIERVAAISGFSRDEILGPRKARAVSYARAAAIMIAIDTLPYSLVQIGHAFHRDHTTVMHVRRMHGKRMESDPTYRAIYEAALKATKEAA